jgi:hypothetical protein
MKDKLGIALFAITEILIGLITLTAVILSLAQGKSIKSLEVLVFVLITAIISSGLGLGILRYKLLAYRLLLYFSSIIILSKILIVAKLITLTGALETTIPYSLKNITSVLYHSLLIFYFTRKSIRELFN